MTDTALKIPAKWTLDCQGKQDFDGTLVRLSTRYWPRGGGFTIMERVDGHIRLEENDERPHIRPSAHATIYLGDTADEYYDDAQKLCDIEAEADTEAEVKAKIEAWVAEQYERIGNALRATLIHREASSNE